MIDEAEIADECRRTGRPYMEVKARLEKKQKTLDEYG